MTKRRVSFGAVAGALVAFALCPGTASAQVVALGASNVQGYGVYPSQAFPALLEAMLRASGRGYTVTNAGISGDTSGGMLARLNSAVPAGTRYVVLVAGGNDRRRGEGGDTSANLQRIRSHLAARGIKVVNGMPAVLTALRSGMAQADGRHLTPQGHQYVAQSVYPAIR